MGKRGLSRCALEEERQELLCRGVRITMNSQMVSTRYQVLESITSCGSRVSLAPGVCRSSNSTAVPSCVDVRSGQPWLTSPILPLELQFPIRHTPPPIPLRQAGDFWPSQFSASSGSGSATENPQRG